MKKLFIVVLFLTFFINSSYKATILKKKYQQIDLLQKARDEAETAVWFSNHFSPEQLHALLNFCTVCYALGTLEHKIIQEAQFLQPMSWHLRFNNENPIISTQTIEMFSSSYERIKHFIELRKALREAYQNIMELIHTPENKNVQAIVKTINKAGVSLIHDYCCQESYETRQLFALVKDNLFQTTKKLDSYGKIFESFLQETYPFKDDEEAEVVKLDVADHYLQQMAIAAQELIKNNDTLAKALHNTKKFATLIFYIYYQAVYEGMQERDFDTCYFELMFDQHYLADLELEQEILHEPLLNKTSFDQKLPE
ncbi:MAG: hypothetical protein AB7R69_01490 [Candidatus Babeliales bacterium]